MLSLVQLLEQAILNMNYRTGVVIQQVKCLPHKHEYPDLHIANNPSSRVWRRIPGVAGQPV